MFGESERLGVRSGSYFPLLGMEFPDVVIMGVRHLVMDRLVDHVSFMNRL